MLLVGCRLKATEFYLFRKCESYERCKTFVCTKKVICQFNPERLPEILVTRVDVSLFKCFSSGQPAPSINQSTNQFIYAMTWDWVAWSIRAGSSFLCLGDFCKKGEKKNRQKSLNSKVEEMQKRSSKIPEEFNMQEGALMPGGRYSPN